jgi:hypothetical protein
MAQEPDTEQDNNYKGHNPRGCVPLFVGIIVCIVAAWRNGTALQLYGVILAPVTLPQMIMKRFFCVMPSVTCAKDHGLVVTFAIANEPERAASFVLFVTSARP